MPNRVIKESIFTSPNFNLLSCQAERHFYRILLLADDHGCLELTPLVVKGRCYPLQPKISEKNINNWNRELELQDIIRIWEQDKRIYGYFSTFSNHQRVRSLHIRKTPEPPKSVNCRQLSSIDGLNPNPNPNPNPNLKEKYIKKKKMLKESDFNKYLNDKIWISKTANALNTEETNIKNYIEKIRDQCISKGFKQPYQYYDLKATIKNWMKKYNHPYNPNGQGNIKPISDWDDENLVVGKVQW